MRPSVKWVWRLGIMLVLMPRPAIAQPFIAQSDEETPQRPAGFSIKKEDPKVIEHLEDFARYRDKKAWDKAFKSLTAAIDTSVIGALAPAKDGFWIPTRLRVRQLLATLPPDGRDAYRLFNDAKAKQDYDQIIARDNAGDGDTLPLLKKLADQYLITTVGDKAADRLGDALMEAGDFDGAAQAYESILTARPDSDLPELMLLVKRATALARAHRWQGFEEVHAQVHEKHAGEKVRIAGKDVPADQYLASLTSTKSSAPAPSDDPVSHSSAINLPATTRPAWQHVFLDTALREKITAQLNTNGWMAQQFGAMLTVTPATATDGKRLYLNWYGIIWALDLGTGKIDWWSSHFSPIAEKVNELGQWQVDQRRFALALAGDKLLTVALRLDRLNNQEPFRLSCLDPATGKKKWASDTGPLQNWAFLGQPLVVDQTIYIIAHPHTAQDLHLLSINLADGVLHWENALGQPQVGNNWRGMPVYTIPVLKHVGDMLYVMTNNGAVLAFDLSSRTVQWAFTYDAGTLGNENQAMLKSDSPGSAFIREGVLYFKDQGGPSLIAIDLTKEQLLFRRPVDNDQYFLGVDDGGYYLAGPTFSLIDPKTRQLLWAPAISAPAAGMHPIRSGNDFLIFSDRGIYRLNPASRSVDLFRGADVESLGGALLRAGDKLLAISNLSVTAYEIGAASAARN